MTTFCNVSPRHDIGQQYLTPKALLPPCRKPFNIFLFTLKTPIYPLIRFTMKANVLITACLAL